MDFAKENVDFLKSRVGYQGDNVCGEGAININYIVLREYGRASGCFCDTGNGS